MKVFMNFFCNSTWLDGLGSNKYPAKIQCTAILPCKMATYQGWEALTCPHTPLGVVLPTDFYEVALVAQYNCKA